MLVTLDDADFMKSLFSQVDSQAQSIERKVANSDLDGQINYGMYSEMSAVVKEELQSVIRPEILNRLDEIIVFEPLATKSLTEIANILLNDAIKRAGRGRKLTFSVADNFMRKLVAEGGMDSQFGARPMRRSVQRYFEDTVSEAIVSEFLTDGDAVSIDLSRDESAVKILRYKDGQVLEVPIDAYNGGIGGGTSNSIQPNGVNGTPTLETRPAMS